MSKENNVVELPKLPENTKQLATEHALVIENLNLKLSLVSERINSAQKDLESLKNSIGGYVNSIKGQYFKGVDKVAIEPSKGLIICQDEPAAPTVVEDKSTAVN